MFIMVLNDGETYTDLQGCRMVWISDTVDAEDIEELLKEVRINDHAEFEKASTIRIFGIHPEADDFYKE